MSDEDFVSKNDYHADEPVPARGANGIKFFDTAKTREEYEASHGVQAEPLPELDEERVQEIRQIERQAKLRATLQLLWAHRTEFERRFRKILRENEVDRYIGNDWLDTLEALQEQNQGDFSLTNETESATLSE